MKPSGAGIDLFHEMLGTYMTSPPGLGYNLCRGVFGMITDPSIPQASIFSIVKLAQFE